MKLKVTNYKLGIIWFIITTILLCFPGHQFPTFDLFDKIQLDKIVHIFIFFGLTTLFILPSNSTHYLIITLLSSFYGVLMEFIQKYFIPNRSFDIWDIAADIVGSFLAYILITKYVEKKKPL